MKHLKNLYQIEKNISKPVFPVVEYNIFTKLIESVETTVTARQFKWKADHSIWTLVARVIMRGTVSVWNRQVVCRNTAGKKKKQFNIVRKNSLLTNSMKVR